MRKIDYKYAVGADRGHADAEIFNYHTGKVLTDDEPLFLFRAQDDLAIKILLYYRQLSMDAECTQLHMATLDDAIADFQGFARDNPERMKTPGK